MQIKENQSGSSQTSNINNIRNGNYGCKVALFVFLTLFVIGFIVYSFKNIDYRNI
jgi:hypothetical protein